MPEKLFESKGRPQVAIRSDAARHGELVVLSLQGLAAREPITVSGRAQMTDDRVMHETRADAQGRIDTALRIPDLGGVRQCWTFSVASAQRDINLTAGPVDILPSR